MSLVFGGAEGEREVFGGAPCVGKAESVVRNLDPQEYLGDNGVEKLLEVLRKSPLQKLPIPDSFSRLERWSSMHKRQAETIPQLLVREEELFVELQASLRRASFTKEP